MSKAATTTEEVRMKTLVIAEKPSVATDLAKVLGRFKRVEDVLENDDYVITAAVGHLVELYMPEDIDKKRYGFWRLSELPIIPEKFDLKPIDDSRSKERLNLLKKQLKRKDIGMVLNACDAGREGELIFTYIYELAKCRKPVRRVWMQSMTPAAIRAAFGKLREPSEMAGLQDAARSRSEADWLIGINGTRAITKRMMGRAKGVATVGRVQTPTLSVVLERELAIRNFKPREFIRIEGEFSVAEGNYKGWLQRTTPVNKSDRDDKADRFWIAADAQALVADLQRAPAALVSDKKKRTRQSSGLLYDLTSLQREANSRFGYSAARTLQLAQSLYEKHKLLTYPRTDSRALPEDYLPVVRQTMGQLVGPLATHAATVLANDWIKPDRRIFNNAQISDHFAIIPTGEEPKKLTTEEGRIYEMVCQRFVAIFFPPAEFDVTTRESAVGENIFKTEGKVLVLPGYLAVYGKAATRSELPALTDADKTPPWLAATGAASAAGSVPADTHKARICGVELKQESTKPPARFTEATLLSAMEGAGKLVDDEELAEAMKEKGLGTPATRANIIDHLIREKYIERDGRNLVATAKAESLFEFLTAVQAEALTRPDLTGEWEYKLRLMETGKITRAEFMQGISALTQAIVDRVKGFEENAEAAPESTIISPTDGKPMKEMLRSYCSQDGEITIYKTISGRRLETAEVQELVDKRQLGPIEGFRSKAGKPFAATLRLDAMNKVGFDFGGANGSGDASESEEYNLDELPQVAVFKESGEMVYETPKAFACARNLRNEQGDTFRLSRSMLGKSLERESVRKLLEEGKSDLIKGFKSKRTGRLFDAFLVLKRKGDIGFEFPPRPAPAAKKAANS